jgi:hypothetical protein
LVHTAAALTRSRGIKLNCGVSLQARPNGLELSPKVPLGVAQLPVRLCDRQRDSCESTNMSVRSAFQLVCIDCDTLGIVLDYAEGAPLSTPIKCRGCGGFRGTLADLRHMALPEQKEIFEVGC